MPDIKKNQHYTIDITGMTHEGQGVGRIEGFTVFVDGAIDGEQVETRIIKMAKTYAIGKLIEVKKASGNRIQPFCGVYKRCGGCNIQHMEYQKQLQFKTDTVRENIRRIGGLDNVAVLDTIGMPRPLNYRNKAQFPVGVLNGGTVIGFYASRSHDIIDHSVCAIQSPLSDKARAIVRDFIDRNRIPVYDEATGKGLLRHVVVRTGFKTGEVMVVIVINGKELPKSGELADTLASKIPGLQSVILNVNTEKTNVILGSRNIRLYGKDTITDYIGRYKFEISPLSFFQVNPVQTEVLYGKALEYAGLTGNETVFDLYCGIGTISLFLSEKARKVYGVEVVEEAIADARRNAAANGVENVEFLVGEAEKVIPRIYEQGVKADVVVVDPPRKGCDEVLLDTLVKMEPGRIVYVSCNPSTLARDLKYLDEHGYGVVEAQPVDMFPHTAHVESIVLMTKCGSEEKK